MIVVITIIAVLVAVAFCMLGEKGRYRYHAVNPARRFCMDCGQRQEAYCWSIDRWDDAWWQAMGEIKNQACKCHKDTK